MGHSVVASKRGPGNKNKSVADELTAAGAIIVEIEVTDETSVTDAIINLIATPTGSRKFRTTVDMMGWGAAIDPYNKQHMELTESIYANFGMSDMLKLAA